MGDPIHHSRLAKEKREAALEEYQRGRYTVVGDLVIKAVEQAIEAAASKEGIHFHLNPKLHTQEGLNGQSKNFPKSPRI